MGTFTSFTISFKLLVEASSGQETLTISAPFSSREFICFIVSLASAEELKEIQVSLKKADKIYIIHQEYGEYTLINNKHKREQIIKKCSYNLIEKIMKENKTNMVDYPV